MTITTRRSPSRRRRLEWTRLLRRGAHDEAGTTPTPPRGCRWERLGQWHWLVDQRRRSDTFREAGSRRSAEQGWIRTWSVRALVRPDARRVVKAGGSATYVIAGVEDPTRVAGSWSYAPEDTPDGGVGVDAGVLDGGRPVTSELSTGSTDRAGRRPFRELPLLGPRRSPERTPRCATACQTLIGRREEPQYAVWHEVGSRRQMRSTLLLILACVAPACSGSSASEGHAPSRSRRIARRSRARSANDRRRAVRRRGEGRHERVPRSEKSRCDDGVSHSSPRGASRPGERGSCVGGQSSFFDGCVTRTLNYWAAAATSQNARAYGVGTPSR